MRTKAKQLVSLLGLSIVLLTQQMPTVYAEETTTTSTSSYSQSTTYATNAQYSNGTVTFDVTERGQKDDTMGYRILLLYSNGETAGYTVKCLTSGNTSISASLTSFIDKSDTYTVEVRSNSNVADTSCTFDYVRPDLELSTPESIAIENNKLVISQVENAANYFAELNLYNSSSKSILSVSIDSLFSDDGTFTFGSYFKSAVEDSDSDTFTIKCKYRALSGDINTIANSEYNSQTITMTKEELLAALEDESSDDSSSDSNEDTSEETNNDSSVDSSEGTKNESGEDSSEEINNGSSENTSDETNNGSSENTSDETNNDSDQESTDSSSNGSNEGSNESLNEDSSEGTSITIHDTIDSSNIYATNLQYNNGYITFDVTEKGQQDLTIGYRIVLLYSNGETAGYTIRGLSSGYTSISAPITSFIDKSDTYTVEVRSNSNVADTSCTFDYVRPDLELSTPESITIENNKLVISQVENAANYFAELNLYNSSNKSIFSVSIDSVFSDDGTFTFGSYFKSAVEDSDSDTFTIKCKYRALSGDINTIANSEYNSQTITMTKEELLAALEDESSDDSSSDSNEDTSEETNNDSDEDTTSEETTTETTTETTESSTESTTESESSDTPVEKSVSVIPMTQTIVTLGNGNVASCVLGSDKVLVTSNLKNLSEENVVINFSVSKSVGYTLNTSSIPSSAQNISLKTEVKQIDTFKNAGFDAVSFIPEVSGNLGFDMIAHLNIGAEYQGKTAYIFKLNSLTKQYDLVKATKINEIGNVSLTVNDISNIIVLFAE